MRLKRLAHFTVLALLFSVLTGAVRAGSEFWYPYAVSSMAGAIRDVAWSSDGSRYAVTLTRGVQVYDADMQSIGMAYGQDTYKSAWQPDGTQLAVASADGITLWDSSAGYDYENLRRLTTGRAPMAWSADGKWLAFSDKDANIWLYDSVTGSAHKAFSEHARARTDTPEVWMLAWNDAGTQIASSAFESPFYIWDVQTGGVILESANVFMRENAIVTWHGTTLEILSLTSPQTPTRLTIENNIVTDPKPRELHPAKAVMAAALSPDGAAMAVWTDNHAVQLLDSARMKVKATLYPAGRLFQEPDRPTTASVAWQPGGKRVIVATSSALYSIDVDIENRKLTLTASDTTYMGWINDIVWSPDGSSLATAHGAIDRRVYADDNRVRVWNANGLVWQSESGVSPVISLAWRPDGQVLASASVDDKTPVRLWNAANGRLLAQGGDGESSARQIRWLPDGHRFALGSRFLQFYDVPDVDLAPPPGFIATLPAPDETDMVEINGFDIRPDGAAIVSRGFPGHEDDVTVWSPDKPDTPPVVLENTNAPHYELGAALTVAYSPDGQWIAAAEGALVYDYLPTRNPTPITIYDASTGQKVRLLRGHKGGATQLAWSANSRLLASAGRDQGVQLWDAITGEAQNISEREIPPGGVVTSVEWSPDGKQVAFGTEMGIFYMLTTTD